MIYSRNLFSILLVLSVLTACKATQETTKTKKSNDQSALSNGDREKVDMMYVDACTHMIRGNLIEAIDNFKDVLEIDPKHHASLYNIARLYTDLKEYDEAIPYGKQALNHDPENIWYYRVLREAYEYKGDFADAIDVQKRILSRFDGEVEESLKLAELYERNLQTNDAITQLGELENKYGINEDVSLRKFFLFQTTKQHEAALGEAEKLISLNPLHTHYYQLQYQAYRELGQMAEAVKSLEELLETDSENSFALLTLADYYKETNQIKKSDEYLFKAFNNPDVDIEGKLEVIEKMLPYAKQELEVIPRVKELVRIVWEVHPPDARLYALRGELYLAEQQADSARINFRKALELNPRDGGVWLSLLKASNNLRDYKQLKDDVEEALSYYPNNGEFMFLNGLATSWLGEYEEAISILEKIRRLGTAKKDLLVQTHIQLGEAYAAVNNVEKAEYNYERSLELDPDNDMAMNAYSKYLANSNKELERAKGMMLRVLELQPNQPVYQDTYGWVLYKIGDYAEAEKWVAKAASKSDKPEILEHYGDILLKMGKQDDAIKKWKEAIKNGAVGLNIDAKLKQ